MKTKAIEHALDELAHLSPTDTTEVRAELEAMRAESEARLKMLYEKSEELRHEWARAENAEAQLAAKDAMLAKALVAMRCNTDQQEAREYAATVYELIEAALKESEQE